MFDARWIADFRIVGDLVEILNTSRVSKNRGKRMDRLIFSYYSKEEIDNFKRNWRKLDLPPYMTRFFIQSIQAYHIREYALTVATLSTLWEGIIRLRISYKQKNKTKSYKIDRYKRIW